MAFERLPTRSSSAVDYLEYDAEKTVLRVAWASGQGDDYPGVTQETVDKLLAAPSLGRALNLLVRPLGGVRAW